MNRLFPGANQRARLDPENSALIYASDRQAAKEGLVKIRGNGARRQEVLGVFDDGNTHFDVMTPNPMPCRP